MCYSHTGVIFYDSQLLPTLSEPVTTHTVRYKSNVGSSCFRNQTMSLYTLEDWNRINCLLSTKYWKGWTNFYTFIWSRYNALHSFFVHKIKAIVNIFVNFSSRSALYSLVWTTLCISLIADEGFKDGKGVGNRHFICFIHYLHKEVLLNKNISYD